MKVELISRTPEEIVFSVSGVKPQFVNSLRRCVFEVPALAVEKVTIFANDTPLFNEVLAHRLGLVPFRFPEEMNFREECSCKGKGCSLCEVFMVIDRTGPCVVKASDIKISNDEVKPAYPDIPIAELPEGGRLKLEAVAVLGTARQHAKWQVGLAYYRNLPVLKEAPEKPERFLNVCPKNSLKAGGKVSVDISCDLCGECRKAGFRVEPKEDSFVFTAESFGVYEPDKLVIKSLDVLEKKVKEFRAGLKARG